MAIIYEESKIKKEGQLLKFQAGNNIVALKSNVYVMKTHYLPNIRRSAICIGENCLLCRNGSRSRQEFYYIVILNGEKGPMNLKPSVFFDMNKIEAATKKDKRNVSWIVIKTGEGKETQYTTSKNEPEEVSKEEIEKNNEMLNKTCIALEKTVAKTYDEVTKDIQKLKKEGVEEQVMEEPKDEENMNEDVNPEDIPF